MQTQPVFPYSCQPTQGYQPADPVNRTSEWLFVSFGQATFDAEGLEGPGRFFSRALHWPGGASGATIGRGYDMGSRTAAQIQADLTSAGVASAGAELLSRAAGLRGAAAKEFFERERCSAPVLTLQEQNRLYEQVTMPETVRDVQRILSKPDVVATYGSVSWAELPLPAQEILFDLRYRGDYTAGTREFLQPLLVAKDWKGVADLMQDHSRWISRGVPAGRALARAKMAEGLRDQEKFLAER
jgi:hypothetical protein